MLFLCTPTIPTIMADSSEFETVRGRFVDICRCVAVPDVVEFAGELLQSNLISFASHQAAIAVTGLPPNNKVAHLVSEAMNNVSNSPDNFYKFISILESRNAQLASDLRSDYSKRQACLPRPKPEDPSVKFVTILRQLYRTAQAPTWVPLSQCQHVKLAMVKEKGNRFACRDPEAAQSRAQGAVDLALTLKVPVDTDKSLMLAPLRMNAK